MAWENGRESSTTVQEEVGEEGCECTGLVCEWRGGVGVGLLLRPWEAGCRGGVGTEFRGLGRMERFQVMKIIIRMILRKQQTLRHLRKVKL